jgi:hypothetical protein
MKNRFTTAQSTAVAIVTLAAALMALTAPYSRA